MRQLFLVGSLMGLADLIPGISGGTVAFLCGIYDRLITSLKTLQFSSIKDVAWSFILPVGGGMILSLLLFSHLIGFLLGNYQLTIYAFFFGVMGASCLTCMRRTKIAWIPLLAGFALAFTFSGMHAMQDVAPSFPWLFLCGTLASIAMLLPGISGSYVLHLLGAYPLIITALSHPLDKSSLQALGFLAVGISVGVALFSRIFSRLLERFHRVFFSLLIGLMMGGMRSLWPFQAEKVLSPLIFIGIGFISLLIIEFSAKKTKEPLV